MFWHRTFRRLPFGLAVSAACLLFAATAASAAEGESPYPNLGDWGDAIATLTIFLLLMVILGKYAWKPIVEQLHRREREIADSLDRAERRQAEAEQLLKMYQARLEAAEAEVEQILLKGRKEASESREHAVEVARQEAQKLLELAKREIGASQHEAVEKLRSSTAELAAEIAEKVLPGGLGPDQHVKLLAESLEEIRRQASRTN